MMRQQRWENGSYFTDFSLNIADMRSFLDMREIVKICTRSPTVSLSNTYSAVANIGDRRGKEE